jgi:excisionase family DNA binding protein
MHVIDAEENQFLAVGGSGAFREGRIVQINRGGLIFIEDVATKRKFVFTFDRLAGYEGQSAAEVGLRPGVRVRFIAREDEVEHAQIIDDGNDPALLTVSEAARILRVSEKMVYRLIKTGDLPGIRIGRLMRISRAALNSLLSLRSESASERRKRG